MSELLSLLLAFPTVVYTGLLALVLLYWVFVIVGALDMDHGGGHDALLDAATAKGEAAAGLLDGHGGIDAHGALDAGLDHGGIDHGGIDADGGIDHGVDGADHAGGDADGGDGGGLKHAGAAAGAFNLRRAPITVTASCVVFFSWILSVCAVRYLGPVGRALPEWLFGLAVLGGSFGLSLPLTSLATKPLEGLFKLKEGRKRHELVGAVCRIKTGTVDAGFGQAVLQDDGAELLINVRIEITGDGPGKLKRGDSAIIIDYDQEREAYLVEAYEDLLADAEKKAHGKAPRTKR